MSENIVEKTSLENLGNGCGIYVNKNHIFGTDAVLLADFAAPKKSDVAVDLGTGCGIIPMLWARDNAVLASCGLEIQSEAVNLAKRSAAEFGGENAPEFFCGDIKNPFDVLKKGQYTLVTCNPPYKANNAGIKSRQSASKIARHELLCNIEDVINTASKLLKFGGRLALCQRPERLSEILSLMAQYKIEPKVLRLVCKSEGKEPWLVLVAGRKGGGCGLRIMPNLNMYDASGNLTDEVKKIYKYQG